ncbi:MAG: DUF4011 domain-containing protein [Anaeroplasmataceae bacterium]|nr:DUF4011 domain-containing protein [Anaeroplasmataceae bacterium]
MKQKLKDISLHLLDLGKRNRLINYKNTGLRTIEVYNSNIDEVFHKITNGAQLSVFQIDEVLKKYHQTIDATNESVEEYSVAKVKDIIYPILRANDLLCYKKGTSLQKVMKSIYREYRNTWIEKGINTLYMTFGIVEYQEKKETYFAPLLLIPLELTMDTGFKVKESEDEIIVNPTLSFLLESEYKLKLADYNENETTFQEYMSKVASILLERQIYVHQQMTIGIYSFLKMNMYHDINEHMDLVLENDNIRYLLGEEQTFLKDAKDTSIYPVVDADASQLEAIQYATNGASFILQGPPGTGKSQTITNMIASLLANDKKVLFVSEKQAALNVVYENLKRAGLESFAIELHSHKANKKEFIEELYKTAILPRYEIKHDIESVDERYAYLSSNLEEYRTKLHQKIKRLDMSLYEIYSAYLKLDSLEFNYPIPAIETLSRKHMEEVKQCLDQYSILCKTLGYDYHQGPFYGFVCKNLSYIRYEAKKDIEELYQFYQELSKLEDRLVQELPFTIKSYKNIVDALPYLDTMIQLNAFLPDYFIKEKRTRLCNLIEQYEKVNESISKSTLKNFLDVKIIRLEGLEEFVLEFERQSKRMLKFLCPGYYRIKKELSAYTKLKMKDADILLKLKEAMEYKKWIQQFTKLKKSLPEDYRPYEYEVLYKDATSLTALPFDLSLNEKSFEQLKRNLIDISIQFNKINTLSLSKYMDKFDTTIIDFISGDIKQIVLKLKDMVDSLNVLDAHAERLDILNKLEKENAITFLNEAIERKIHHKKLSSCYEYSFWQANLLYEVEHEPIFKKFSGLGIDANLEEFKQLDQAHLEANKAYIISKLSNCRPDESIMVGSRFSILVKEYNKSRKHKPIRLLLEEIFDLILDIKPVFLMSPLSVSTYLNSELNMFDCVIFDEASQVFAWDALGAIYRARQCIIIGDSKQMPPSNFFTSLIEDDSDYENDIESILDKGSSVFPTKRLNWHYRSRSEELIAFSNQNFYDNRLITIPETKRKALGYGIDFRFVMGTYEVKARTNIKEARYIVDLVFEHIKNQPNHSLGVVAFSNTQADLISDLVEERLKEMPEYRNFFLDNQKEPFFVKNLESVQGDERDVILFSICFGYTEEHKFYQRFGPLNALGGERRLNVAITRAKERICVVSSIQASDIKLDQTESVGVAMLKKYLAYAQMASSPNYFSQDTSDGVIESIVQFLHRSGYETKTNLGASAFKIDIAVQDRQTKEYTTAIMLDGPSYLIGNCSDANALHEKLLSRLGWKFIRVFSTQWIHQPIVEKERILHLLRNKEDSKIESNLFPQKESFLVEVEDDFDASFPEYPKVSDEKIEDLYNHRSTSKVIEYIISKEEPIHIEYLLKRICFMYGRTKVTTLVRDYFEQDIEELELYRDKEFLSIHPVVSMELRIPSDRAIEYIHIEELKDALYKIVKKSNGITKEGCFKKVVGLLGYNRMSDRTTEILEQALTYLKLDGKVVEKQECLYI